MAESTVFISHSCKDAVIDGPKPIAQRLHNRLVFARCLRTKLTEAINEQLGPETVWFDTKRVDPGSDWEQRIFDTVHNCDAAVILLTPDSIKSPWVLREATILLDRRLRNPDFIIVVILSAGLSPEKLDEDPRWNVIRILKPQCIKAPTGKVTGPGADSDIAYCVAKAVPLIVKAVEAKIVAEEIPPWAEDLAGHLKLIADLSPGRLDRAAHELQIKPSRPWDRAGTLNLARAMASSSFDPTDDPQDAPLLTAASAVVGDVTLVRPDGDERLFCEKVKPAILPATIAIALGSAYEQLGQSGGNRGPIVAVVSDSVPPTRSDIDIVWLTLQRTFAPNQMPHELTRTDGEDDSMLDPTASARLKAWLKTTRIKGKVVVVIAPVPFSDSSLVTHQAKKLAAAIAAIDTRVQTIVVAGRPSVATQPRQPGAVGGDLPAMVAFSEQHERFTSELNQAFLGLANSGGRQ